MRCELTAFAFLPVKTLAKMNSVCTSTMPSRALLVPILTTLVLLAPSATAAEVDFQREVRPLLSDACFQCHGPDPNSRLVDLRLDTREGVYDVRANGAPIVPGDRQASLVYQRISATDASKMPPEYSHKKLEPNQIELIGAWIDSGARWSEHWSFRAPERPELPPVKNESWVRNPIDRFILARLEAVGLEPADQAPRRTLIRRVSLDLTGLPPEPEQVAAFLADSQPGAYERLVDGLLDSQAYGEHRARYWLDAARYADTHGLHIDNYREMWPYRDWVIDAFNRNLPFDEFTIEQLAGDLLPKPTQAQLVATGFQRCNITTNEGGVIDEEVDELYARDRAETVGTVWLGLTIGCATCHDHKFDPLTQKDFYSMGAFFRNTTQPTRDGNVHDTPPIMLVISEQDESRWNELKQEIPEARRALVQLRTASAKQSWKSIRKKADQLSFDRFDDSEVFDLERWAQDKTLDGVTETEGPQGGVTALEVEDDHYIEAAGFTAIASDKPFTIATWFRMNDDGRRLIAGQVEYVGDDRDSDERGWRLELSSGRPSISLIGDREFELGLSSEGKGLKAGEGEWHHVAATYDGSRHRSGLLLYLDGTPVRTVTSGRALRALEGEIGRSVPLTVGGRRDREDDVIDLLDGAIADFRILNRELTPSEVRLLSRWVDLQAWADRKPKRAREALVAYQQVREHEKYRRAADRLARLEAERRRIRARSPMTHVMSEKIDSQPMAHVLYRGMYDQRREQVGAVTPAVLPPMAAGLPRNRMGLARWLVDEANPLTARVTVNRMWQEVFGSGIVRTPENFGSQGQAPTHRELLDWLAVDFRESGWDVKGFYKQLLTSAAYRQSAQATAAKLEKDSENLLLSRGPRFRMDGEVLRDYALAVGDLLNNRVGGASVKPYQPDDVWESVAMRQSNTRFYEADSGEDLYRRSLYTFWKRAAPPASMVTFDAPTREHSTVRRERTNTPLQALVTMNDPQFFEAARHLAQNAQSASEQRDGQLDFMAAKLLARDFTAREREVARQTYLKFLHHYVSHPDDAREMLAVGASEPDLSRGTAELAALTMLANQLLNLDEVLNK